MVSAVALALRERRFEALVEVSPWVAGACANALAVLSTKANAVAVDINFK
jgi:hypothetical protein